MAELQVSELPLITNITIDDMLIVNDGNATTSICSWADALASIRQLQGQVLFDNGVETLPSISFVNDISTGIYNPNQGEVAITTNAVQRFVVDGEGHVGIANYVPGDYNNDANNLVIGDIDLGDNGMTIVSGNTYAGIINFADGTGVDASVGQIVYDHSDDHMGFHTSGTESMRINFEGDVTIGTSLNQLGSRLTVDGGSITVASGTSSIPAYNFVGDGDSGIFNPSPDTVSIVTGGIAHAFFDAEGQMGIGVQDALADIHIRRDNPTIRIEDSSQPGFPYATASTSNGDVIIDADPADFAVDSKILLRVDGEEQIRVDNGGSLIINNDVYFNDPANGTVNAYGVITHDRTTGSIVIGSDPDNQYDNSVLSVEVDGTEQIQIRENGDIDLVNDGNVTFGADYDTFLYHPAADQLALSTAGQERLRVGDLGHILIGATAPRFIAQNSPGLQVSGNAPTASAAFMIYSPDTQGTGIHLGKSRSSTIGGVAAVQTGDQLGYAAFSGADGTSMNAIGASIVASVDNAVATNSVPTRMMLNTTSVGETSPVPRLLVESKGTTRVINSPAADTALAVGIDGQETLKVTTEGDITAKSIEVENVNLAQLDWLPGTGPG